ncbi:hypothetical protein AHAS_Ahas13G0348200 [Arachis hypogaea]
MRYFGFRFNLGNFKTTYYEYVINLNQRTDMHIVLESSRGDECGGMVVVTMTIMKKKR